MQLFHCPTKLYLGAGALDALGGFQAQRVLVVTDSFFSKNGTALEVGRRVPGAEVRIFDNVVPDPPASLAAEGAALCAQFRPQLLIALGGGSPMDCAKAIRMASDQPMTFVAIPTTSGSGSEMTSFSILTHDGVKHPLVDPSLRPDAAILDDSLLTALPPSLIADTGMDLLAHCLEALAAAGASGFTDALAFEGARRALALLPASYQGDRSVRLRLHEAASMAGMAFDNAGLGVCHALAHALGGAFHIPHGRLCAMLLPSVLSYNAPAAQEKYACLARLCGLPSATDRLAVRNLSAAIVRLRKQLHLPETLGQAGVTTAQWEEKRAQVVTAALADACCRTNPVPVTEAGLLQLCKAVAP